MEDALDETELDLSTLFSIRDSDGRPALSLGLLATVYFDEPWTWARREAVADVAEAYMRQFRAHLRWGKDPETYEVGPINAGKVSALRAWLLGCEEGESWDFGFHGGDTADAVSEFQVSGFGSDRNLGFLQVYLPLGWLAEHPGAFPGFVLKMCERIQPLSGYAGLGILEPLLSGVCGDFHPTVRQIAERFPGIEVEDRVGHGIHLHTGIKGVNWLTILGERWIETVGGLDYLRVRLDDNFTFYRYGGGLMIQAGPKPQIGDVQANRWPKHYVTLAKVLKKIQIPNHYPFHQHAPGRMDKAATMAWLYRFDGK